MVDGLLPACIKIQLTWDSRGIFRNLRGSFLIFLKFFYYNLPTPIVFFLWTFSQEDDISMTDLCFREGTGRVIYMRLSGQRRALAMCPAETWLTL